MFCLGREQRHNPQNSFLEKVYILTFGMPIVGLRIRGRNVFRLIPKHRDYKQVLDAGSGTGVFSFELARRFPDASILGIDLEETSIGTCRHISKHLGYGNIRFRQQPIAQLPETNAFDLIVCVDILEHIEDDDESLKVLYRATAPKGLLLLHVPSYYRRYPVFKKRPNFDVPTHFRIGYKPEEIRKKVLKTGFSIRKMGLTYGFWETLSNNLSYMITRARMKNRFLYSIFFPVLNLISLVGIRARPKNIGAGIFILAEKGDTIEPIDY
jgi:2-polyprenyl-3-methyl-5-hydroxy-6-metoxy-1,4-benzoquinol methylase